MAFYYSRKILLAITLAIFLAGTSPRRVSGQNCGCADDECCSRTGDCGTGEDYCGEGCQEGPCYPASNTVRNATFSRSHPNQNCGCDPELCCSQSGDCGTGEDYCGEGCQEGPCDFLKPPSNTVRNATFSRSHPNQEIQDCDCATDQCCSQSGDCGTGEDYCGEGCQEGPCF